MARSSPLFFSLEEKEYIRTALQMVADLHQADAEVLNDFPTGTLAAAEMVRQAERIRALAKRFEP